MTILNLTNPSLLPQPSVPPIESAVYKAVPTDFIVKENMAVDFTDEGEHLWLEIEKTGINTAHLAKQLAKWANIAQRDVGYSGIKDRHAVTTQWFSLRLPKKQSPEVAFSIHDDNQQEFAKVLQQRWHNKKLNRSTHKSNDFKLTLRHVITHKDTLEARLTQISEQGVPNYFGEQRFGHGGNNILNALEWFEQGTISGRKPHPKKSRDKQSLLLSAARSAIFNQILAKRVQDGSWQTGLDGDVFNLSGSGSVFATEQLDDELTDRLARFDIHPTGILWGVSTASSTNANDKQNDDNSVKKQPNSSITAKKIQEEVINGNDVLARLAKGLEDKQLKKAHRSLRLMITNLAWQWQDDTSLQLTFQLPSGSYATSLLLSLINQHETQSS